jgi:Protein of unknown function (DUF3617)
MRVLLKIGFGAAWLLGLAPVAIADDTPPVRPGLWEVTVSGPSVSERIKNTPADKRQSMEQIAGISIRGETMVRRVCITPEMLAQGISTRNRPDCEFKQTWKGKVTKVLVQCPNGGKATGELTYPNKETFKGWIDSEKSESPQRDTAPGKTDAAKKTTRVLHSGKWMAKDCATVLGKVKLRAVTRLGNFRGKNVNE